MVDWTRIDGTTVPTGTTTDPGSLASTLDSVNVTATAASLAILTRAATITSAQTTTLADLSHDIDQFGNIGSWAGHSAGVQNTYAYRIYIRFPISLLPHGLTLGSVKLDVQSDWQSGNGADTYIIGPYNGNGLGNPALDSGLVAYGRCDPTLDYYLTGDTQLRTTGAKEWELGAQAIADLSAALAASETYFTIALKQTDETTGSVHTAAINAYNTSTPPRLIITKIPLVIQAAYAHLTLTTHKAIVTDSAFNITSVTPTTLAKGQTGIVIAGANFGTTKGIGLVKLNTEPDGSGDWVSQTVTSWSNTSITFNIWPGTKIVDNAIVDKLSPGTVYVIVSTNSGTTTAGFPVTLRGPLPVITSLSTTTSSAGERMTITGTNFGTATGTVELNTAQDGSGSSQTQTVVSWSDTSIVVTIVKGSLPYGTLYVIVHEA